MRLVGRSREVLHGRIGGMLVVRRCVVVIGSESCPVTVRCAGIDRGRVRLTGGAVSRFGGRMGIPIFRWTSRVDSVSGAAWSVRDSGPYVVCMRRRCMMKVAF